MILINQLKMPVAHKPEELHKKIATVLKVKEQEIKSVLILRRSVDARKKPQLFYIYSVEVECLNEGKIVKQCAKNKNIKEQISISNRTNYEFPVSDCIPQTSPIVIGAGPAGLFCAYLLAKAGWKPILLERGFPVEERQKAVDLFWEKGLLNPASNVQFGEGGAGTFSDGKLNTLVKDKDGRNRAVLELFVKHGADEKILYDAKPHIGTDVLCKVIRNIRNAIVEMGGQVRFESQVTDLLIGNRSGSNHMEGVVVNGTEKVYSDNVVLAIGHSARDTFYLLKDKNIPMEAKSFAVGFRVEHPQQMINVSQYGTDDVEELGAAPYKLTAQTTSGRGVYSFCMCPGGYVVNASSEEGRLAVNGMSYSKRDSANANSAIIVAVSPKDFGSEEPLAGVEFQRRMEEKAYQLADGRIPVEYYGDFKKSILLKDTTRTVQGSFGPCLKGKYAFADLTGILPQECNEAFVEGMEQFGKMIKGFNREDAIMSGVESRTSSPVRIVRDEFLQSSVKGLFPCGEGAGYAGGITSAAMDGMRVAEMILAGSKIDVTNKIK